MIERVPFGATGHESSRVIFGAAALGSVTKADADRALEVLLEHGVNHIDVAAELRRRGAADRHLAAAPPGTFFLATKTGERDLPRRRARRSAARWTGSASTRSTRSSCTTSST